MVKRKLTVGGLIGHLASVSHFHKKKKYKKNFIINLFLFFIIIIIFPHAISFWNIIPGSLLPLFSNGRAAKSP